MNLLEFGSLVLRLFVKAHGISPPSTQLPRNTVDGLASRLSASFQAVWTYWEGFLIKHPIWSAAWMISSEILGAANGEV